MYVKESSNYKKNVLSQSPTSGAGTFNVCSHLKINLILNFDF